MPLTYATPADYYAHTGRTVPADLSDEETAVLAARLIRASATVRGLAVGNGGIYALDTATGKPSDARILDAFRDATCALVAGLFDREGDGLTVTDAPAEYDTISMAGVTLGKSTRRSTDAAVEATAAEQRALSRDREALGYLVAAGIFGSRVPRLT